MLTQIIEYIQERPELELLLTITLIVAAGLIVKWIAMRGSSNFIRRAIRLHKYKTSKDEKQREDTLISIVHTGIGLVVWIMVAFFILGAFGFDILPLIAGAGVIGVALAFGAQSLVKDFFASLFILGENQYRVGDVLQVNQGVAGLVERITLRMTVLRDLDGKVHYIPNGSIELATNMTMEFAQVDLNIGVAYSSDIDQVEQIINKVGKDIYEDKKWEGVILEPAHMLRVDSFGDSAITVKIVCKTAPIRQWEVKSEILRKIKKAFDKEGIEIPFPQRVIHTK